MGFNSAFKGLNIICIDLIVDRESGHEPLQGLDNKGADCWQTVSSNDTL